MQISPRIIRPGFLTDYEFCRDVPREFRLFYVGLWMAADDRGGLLDSPPEIKTLVYPYDADMSFEVIAGMVDTLIRLRKLVRYQVGTKRYLLLVNFLKHQKITRPAKRNCCPLAADIPFDEGAWSFGKLPDHYFEQATNGYSGVLQPRGPQAPAQVQAPAPVPVPDPQPVQTVLQVTETQEAAAPSEPVKKKRKSSGPVYTDDEKLVVRHLKERLMAAGADHFPRDWHIKMLPAAKRLMEGHTAEEVMACIDWAFWKKEQGQMVRSLDHLIAIESVWPRYKIEKGGADNGSGNSVRQGNWRAPAGVGPAGPAVAAGTGERDYGGGEYASFFGGAMAGGGRGPGRGGD